MKFGPVPVGEALGAILAHSVRHPSGVIRKGRVLTAEDVATLRAAGIGEVTVARLSSDDVHEDAAAERLAAAIAGDGIRIEPPFTGRANLYATTPGVLVLDRGVIDRINGIDPAITVATLSEFAAVAIGQMVATVKIIPFAVDGEKLRAAAGLARSVLRVAAFRPMKVGLVATTLPALKTAVLDKTRRLLDRRLEGAGAAVFREDRVVHTAPAVASSLIAQKADGAELLVAFGASAVVDAADVIPAAIEQAGGRVVRFGMPVDPGNLLVLGDLGGTPVIGAPGCARSPKENGFDWILNRLLAGLDVTSEAIAGLGVGGLLMEIASRPQPREGDHAKPAKTRPPRIAALLLAAGRSVRMGGPNKLLATVGGRPLVRIQAEAALASRAGSLTVVTGHDAPAIEAALAGLDVWFVHNPDFAEGLSTSLRAGLRSLSGKVDGVMVLLADMPGIGPDVLDRLMAAFDPGAGAEIVVPTWRGRRGNPVLWAARFLPQLEAATGDAGGRHLIDANTESVVFVETGPAVTVDVDTPEALAKAGGVPA